MSIIDDLLREHGKTPISQLKHYGKKGMKWGVRNDKGHAGERAKTKKISKLDQKFEKDAGSLKTAITLHNRAADLANTHDVGRINNKPEYANADFRRDSPLRQQYYREHETAFLDRLDQAAAEMGTNASGTKRYAIQERPDGSWDVELTDVEHADGPGSIRVHVTYDDQGFIKRLSIPNQTFTLSHGDTDYTFSLIHYGVKGMKWGVRKDRSGEGQTVDVFQKRPGKRLDATGGKGLAAHPDAVRAATSKQKAKASTSDALSDNELKDLVNRMNLEQNYARLQSTENQQRMSVGKRFVRGLLGDVGRGARQQANVAGNKVVGHQVDQALKKKNLIPVKEQKK